MEAAVSKLYNEPLVLKGFSFIDPFAANSLALVFYAVTLLIN